MDGCSTRIGNTDTNNNNTNATSVLKLNELTDVADVTGATGTANESTANQPCTSKPSQTNTSQTSKNQPSPREWTLESIRALKRFMDIEFQQLRMLEEIEQIDESVKFRLISSVLLEMEQDYFSSAVDKILVKRTYDNGLWFKNMVFRQGKLQSERGKLQILRAKADFKRIACAITSDFGIDLVNRMSKNVQENVVRKKHRIDI